MLKKIIPILFVLITVFSHAQTLTITSPSSSDEWGISTTNSITWSSAGYSGTIDIVLVNVGNSSETLIATGETNDGTYSWKVPANLAPGSYEMTISDNKDATTVSSDVQFSIMRQIWLSGTMNSNGGNAMTYRDAILGSYSWIYTYQETGSADVEFKFRDNTDNWTQGNWGHGAVVSMSTSTTWDHNGGNGTFSPITNYYYTFIHKEVDNGTNSEGFVFETAATPVSLLAVEHSPLFVTPADVVTVSVTTSAAPSIGEKGYVVYTLDEGVNFEFVEAAFVGTTGTASIPAQSSASSVLYFPITTGNIADMSTVDWTQAYIDILLEGSHGGAYGYTVYEPVNIVINEVDYDTPGSVDALEFIEFYDGGTGSVALDGLVVVFYDGNDDKVYESYDLDGYNTSLTGYFVLGNPSVASLNYGISNNTIQNETGAVALYYGDDTDFPIGSSLKTENLIDAFVYGDSADPGLLVLLNPAQPQVDENSGSNSANVSSQRIVNGSGGARNTISYQQAQATPGKMNIGETLWTGDFDENFSDIRNWTNGIPTTDYKAIIPFIVGLKPYPIISAGVTVNINSLEIAAGAEFTIEATGTLNTNNSVVIQSDVDASGSLLNFGTIAISSKKSTAGTTTPILIYNRYILGNQWHMIGSPLLGQSINSTFLSTNSIIGMKDYIESENPSAWSTDYNTTAPNASFSLGKGYAIKNNTTGVISLTGTPNIASKGVTLSRSAYGWNLLSNPFTSAIAANSSGDATNNLLTVNTGVLETSFVALYLWDPTTLSYKIINHSSDLENLSQNYLQVGQGFFVKAASNGLTFSMTPAMQSHQTSIPFKLSESDWVKLTLNAEIATAKASTQILYREDMSRGLDIGYDAGLLDSYPAFSLYTKLVEDNGVDFGLQCLPTDYENLIVPIGLDAEAGELVSFSAQNINIPQEYAIILEDRALGISTDLSDADSKYSIQLSEDADGFGRFYIHTSFKSSLGFGDIDIELFKVFAVPVNNQLIVKGAVEGKTIAKIYSITGKLVGQFDLKHLGENKLSFNEESGIYIIQISSSSNQFTQKFIWVQ